MPLVTVTAAEGERLQIRLQKRVEKASIVQTHGFDEQGNPTLVSAFGAKVTTWPDQGVDTIASESRSYTVDADNRIVVEPAA
ncbi:hypothetical protein [Bradyrhizobium stylosanthis]|uniref:Uncharacterized protein n=1 Tax=Bradyrhizobium stylosanthis TaxID=1803665 RepID=A0A560CXI6_9BRAD|nr:hypothetical protein [Bradyrhizobium stylosanthis]TWA89569.1 hypothetical protein FBZ96_11937 [Bradyrhizobium stylosanthis]